MGECVLSVPSECVFLTWAWQREVIKPSLLICVWVLTLCIHLCIAVYEVALHKDKMKVLEQKKVLPLGHHIRSYFHSFLNRENLVP